MTIIVRSNDAPTQEAKPATAAKESGTQSALAGQTAEHKKSEDSDTSEPEAKEEEHEIHEDESEDESEKSEESKDEAKDKPKKKSGFQRRIDKLNAKFTAEQQRAAALEARLAQLESAGGKKTEVEAPKKASTDGRPDPDKFNTHAEYVEALADWKFEQKRQAHEEESRKKALQTEQQKTLEAHTKRVKSFAEKTEDFQDVLENVDDLPVSQAVQELLISSENGPELMYELAKNRAEFERISSLSPISAARELGRFESKFLSKASATGTQETKKLTNAPKPIDPVGAKGGSGTKSIYDPNLSQKDYERIRAKQRSTG